MLLTSTTALTRFLCCFLFTLPLHADQFGNMTFTPPSGWARVQQPDSLDFVLKDKSPSDAVVLSLLQDRELSGEFQTAFASIVQSRVIQQERILQRTAPAPIANDTGAKGLFQILVIQDAAGREVVRAYMGFQPGNRIDVLSLAAPNQDAFRRVQPVFKEFVSHLRFKNLTPDR